jgi:hypothetical protein
VIRLLAALLALPLLAPLAACSDEPWSLPGQHFYHVEGEDGGAVAVLDGGALDAGEDGGP